MAKKENGNSFNSMSNNISKPRVVKARCCEMCGRDTMAPGGVCSECIGEDRFHEEFDNGERFGESRI